jgi:acetoin utilization protein AcuC
VDGQRASYLALAALAREVTAGRWVATGGGGYEIADVVPRAWTHLLAVVAGRPLDPATPTPQAWRDYVHELLGRAAPETMTDLPDGVEPTYRDWSGGYDPDDWLDRSVLATREAAFPLLGLDPHH